MGHVPPMAFASFVPAVGPVALGRDVMTLDVCVLQRMPRSDPLLCDSRWALTLAPHCVQ